ncbi:hypothetical protein A4R63_10100 [Corynebacterium pseudotuberculosis]|nr:hypothetical protein ATN03_10145 [Corynebacterium pseudotuberculosis]AMN74474.1 hypothetical protein ATN04_09120 [Corynebacterium pseudotuberculosis]AMN76075.1 hypothetical protein ATN05_07190 [Corynebacterium pseudotuberculosis]ANZ92199.1 hypothetical protein CPMB20_07190 [Corynebacterium pseudotuberculosis]APB11774.1 hypothetical protein A4R72_10335 [Corynebacterium pseudotuberculosis]
MNRRLTRIIFIKDLNPPGRSEQQCKISHQTTQVKRIQKQTDHQQANHGSRLTLKGVAEVPKPLI